MIRAVLRTRISKRIFHLPTYIATKIIKYVRDPKERTSIKKHEEQRGTEELSNESHDKISKIQ